VSVMKFLLVFGLVVMVFTALGVLDDRGRK
jgi:hypothetical protein